MPETGFKIFKDPVYGYLEIPCHLVDGIIDTPEFQRLRCVRQTSYDPLFPSATHNRFVHSLGVYHLGSFVSRLLEHQCRGAAFRTVGSQKAIVRAFELLQLACLLHDFGHAPFSHTGEDLYRDEDGNVFHLHERIDGLIGGSAFLDYSKLNSKLAAPHELMSVIVSLTKYGTAKWEDGEPYFGGAAEKEFFARAITGYKYVAQRKRVLGVRVSFLNCLIALLNSSLVDVDRLDYLMRDAFNTGFNTMNIDYRRLLTGLRIECAVGECQLTYTKSSICVLENVIYAHDAERKWVQNHPAIKYELRLLDRAMRHVRQKYPKVFSEEAFSEKGIRLGRKGVVARFLSDTDLLFLMKNFACPESRKFFDRRLRHRPLWKSETEFHALFGRTTWEGGNWESYARFTRALFEYVEKYADSAINVKALKTVGDEVRRDKAQQKKSTGARHIAVSQHLLKVQLFKDFFLRLQKFATERSLEFHFDLISTDSFRSGFYKSELSKVLVKIPARDAPVEFGRITNLFKEGVTDLSPEMHYIFCEKSDAGMSALAKDFVGILRAFVNEKVVDITAALALE